MLLRRPEKPQIKMPITNNLRIRVLALFKTK